jgi:hypothetical protein
MTGLGRLPTPVPLRTGRSDVVTGVQRPMAQVDPALLLATGSFGAIRLRLIGGRLFRKRPIFFICL